MMSVTMQQMLREARRQPTIPDEIKQFLIRHSYRTGNEDCESAWTHIATCEECCARLYLVAVIPELAGQECWWQSPESWLCSLAQRARIMGSRGLLSDYDVAAGWLPFT